MKQEVLEAIEWAKKESNGWQERCDEKPYRLVLAEELEKCLGIASQQTPVFEESP
jgi:hypothetical protein